MPRKKAKRKTVSFAGAAGAGSAATAEENKTVEPRIVAAKNENAREIMAIRFQ